MHNFLLCIKKNHVFVIFLLTQVYGCLTFSYCFTSHPPYNIFIVYLLPDSHIFLLVSWYPTLSPHMHHSTECKHHNKTNNSFLPLLLFLFLLIQTDFQQKRFFSFFSIFFLLSMIFLRFFLSFSLLSTNVLFSCLWEKYCLTTCLFLDELNTSTSCFFFWYLIETGTGDFCVVCYVTETQQ